MTTKNCRGCGAVLTTANDSEAHIIPKALGGRLKPKGIICRTCNTALDKLADNALIKAFGDWPTLLDIPREGGDNPTKIIDTTNNRRVRVQPDGTLTAMNVKYEVMPTEDGYAIEIAAGDMKTIRQLLQRAKKQFPTFDAKAAEQHAKTMGVNDGDALQMRLDFSPKAAFGGIITALWLFIIDKTGHALMDWQNLLLCIQSMQSHGGTFRYFPDGLPGLKGPDIPLGHKIVVRTVPRTAEMIVYVEILGMLKVGGFFAVDQGGSGQLHQHIYAYDVLGRADRSADFSINAEEFEKQNWRTAGLGPTDAARLRDHFRDELERVFIQHYRDRFSTASTLTQEGAGDVPRQRVGNGLAMLISLSAVLVVAALTISTLRRPRRRDRGRSAQLSAAKACRG